MTRFLRTVALLLALVPGVAAAELRELFAERVRCTVAIEFFTESETERAPSVVFGVVVDAEGLVVLPASAINSRTTPTQQKDFRVYLPDQPVTTWFAGEYLGQDQLTGWHFVRVEPKGRLTLVPVGRFAAPKPREPGLGEELWGVALRKKDEDFTPYLLASRVGLVQSLPQRTAITLTDCAGNGLPVFDRDGYFAGLGVGGFGQSFMQFSNRDRGGLPVVLINPDECAAVQLAAEVLPNVGRVPKQPSGRPIPWLGAHGLEPIDPEVAKFLKLGAQTGVVVSEVLEGSPAELAGLKPRDIIVALDGQPLPRLKPDQAVVGHVDREINRHEPGDTVALTVLRGPQRLELRAGLGDAPKLWREAERHYFPRLGLTAREFVYGDGVARRARLADHGGVVAHFVKPSAPASAAGLRDDDWIREIDGAEVTDYASAVKKLAAIEADAARTEFVLLVNRGGETAVLRVKLK